MFEVVSMSEWPSQFLTSSRLQPLSKSIEAVECRKSWNRIRGSPMCASWRWNVFVRESGRHTLPSSWASSALRKTVLGVTEGEERLGSLTEVAGL